jgi:hypothetical protein
MATTNKTEHVTITAPNIQSVQVRLVGTAPLMTARFSQKAMRMMQDKMTGVTKAGSRVREKRDFNDDYEQAKHVSADGWPGFPSSGLRAAMVSACRLVDFQMTRAKISIFVKADGYDVVDGVGLFQIYGEPHPNTSGVRNATGVLDLRVRPMWDQWFAEPVVQYDADQFSLSDVINLLKRAGMQVGLGEGRPDSKKGVGLGFGTFDVETIDQPRPFKVK